MTQLLERCRERLKEFEQLLATENIRIENYKHRLQKMRQKLLDNNYPEHGESWQTQLLLEENQSKIEKKQIELEEERVRLIAEQERLEKLCSVDF